MSELVSIERDGPAAARRALERAVLGGGVVVFPADGVYGLGCDPASAAAIARIHELKGREPAKPSAVMYLSPLAMRELVGGLGERSRRAVSAFLPGPVTLVVENPERRYPLACATDPTRLGVRLIGGPLAGAMCPMFQTSANLAGHPPAAAFGEVAPALVAGADLAIDGGELAGTASTVIDVSRLDRGEKAVILREGALSRGAVEARLEALGAA